MMIDNYKWSSVSRVNLIRYIILILKGQYRATPHIVRQSVGLSKCHPPDSHICSSICDRENVGSEMFPMLFSCIAVHKNKMGSTLLRLYVGAVLASRILLSAVSNLLFRIASSMWLAHHLSIEWKCRVCSDMPILAFGASLPCLHFTQQK